MTITFKEGMTAQELLDALKPHSHTNDTEVLFIKKDGTSSVIKIGKNKG